MVLNLSEQRTIKNFDLDPAAYASSYQGQASPSAVFFQRRRDLVMSFLPDENGASILDVGCGPGIYAQSCAERGLRYWGLDISERMIDEARKRYRGDGVDFSIGTVRQLPFPSCSFDGVLCLGVLEYVSKNDERTCLKELVRVVRPGGTIIFSFLNARSPYWIWIDLCYPLSKFIYQNLKALSNGSKCVRFKDCYGESLPTRKFSLRERLDTLRTLDLAIRDKIYFCLNLFPPPLSTKFALQAMNLTAKLELLLKQSMFGWMGMAFLIVVGRPGEVGHRSQDNGRA